MQTPREDERHALLNTQHQIETRGSPVSAKARRLPPDKLAAGKLEFQHMVELGICRPSKSQWSSPLHMIPVASEYIEKVAIVTPFGLYEFFMLPFGLRNAAQTFQGFIHEITRDMPFVTYIDDILVASSNEVEHNTHLRTIFTRLREYNIQVNFPKGNTAARRTSETHPGISTAQNGFASTVPRSNQLYRCPSNTAAIQSKLYTLTSGQRTDNRKVAWSDNTIHAFERLRESLSKATLLVHSDNKLPLVLMVDASHIAVGASINQIRTSMLEPLAFFSKMLTNAQKKYRAYNRELLAAYLAVKHFRFLLEGREFCIYTDHKPLSYAFLQRLNKASPKQFR
ncbi:hypothetical protein Trydic_g17285 [Trypoxylus dichotomus]